MFRVNWDSISPASWLASIADEEAFMSEFETDFPSSTFLFIPVSQRENDEPIKSGDDDEEEEETTVKSEKMKSDDDFFSDLPLGARNMDTQVPANLKPPQKKTKDGYSFYTYSFNTCSTLDDSGHRLKSTRRRYEDSAGRLKATHIRKIGDRSLQSTWMRENEKDKGKHDKKVSSGTVHSFECAWKESPFGLAEKYSKTKEGKEELTELPDKSPESELP